MSRYTYKDELYKRLEIAFPDLNIWKIKRIAEDIINNKSNDPSIVHNRGTQRTIVESWIVNLTDKSEVLSVFLKPL